MATPVEARRTARLHLRRLVPDDLAAVVVIDSDPRTNEHRPGGAPTPEKCSQTFREFVRTWEEHGIGYWAVEVDGQLIGVAGVEPSAFGGQPCWNLYYRLAPVAWGRGFATEAATEAVAVAETLQPEWPVVARTRPTNVLAARVARSAGLRRRPHLDADGYIVFARGW
jgi:RimJ/RimL family protein N-acetyltransferase